MLTRISIQTRLTLTYSALLFLALAIFGGAAIATLHYRLTARMEATLDRKIQGLERFLIRETTPEKAHMIAVEAAEYAFTQPEGHLIEVTDGSGHQLLKSDTVTSPAMVREDSFQLYGQRYVVRAAASLDPIEESTRELTQLLFWSAPLLLLMIGVTGYWISRRALAPVDEMTHAASRISVHSLERRLRIPRTRDELSRLAEAWNQMLARLEQSVSRMGRFTADAAHELRTPLTALRTTADLALRRPRDAGEYREALQQVVRISDRMTRLVDALLVLARSDETKHSDESATVDLARCIREVAQEMQPLIDAKDQQLKLHLPAGPALVSADEAGMSRLVTSLLDNARKYTPAGGLIELDLLEHDDSFELQVQDSGAGIPAESLVRVFDRFYRVDESRDRQTGGHGLGLAIAHQIVQAHHGTIEAATAENGGAIFRVRLPKLMR
jgi:two-component system heavy metal sensor histidine kinase CusS